jgi:hypothetical protein
VLIRITRKAAENKNRAQQQKTNLGQECWETEVDPSDDAARFESSQDHLMTQTLQAYASRKF